MKQNIKFFYVLFFTYYISFPCSVLAENKTIADRIKELQKAGLQDKPVSQKGKQKGPTAVSPKIAPTIQPVRTKIPPSVPPRTNYTYLPENNNCENFFGLPAPKITCKIKTNKTDGLVNKYYTSRDSFCDFVSKNRADLPKLHDSSFKAAETSVKVRTSKNLLRKIINKSLTSPKYFTRGTIACDGPSISEERPILRAKKEKKDPSSDKAQFKQNYQSVFSEQLQDFNRSTVSFKGFRPNLNKKKIHGTELPSMVQLDGQLRQDPKAFESTKAHGKNQVSSWAGFNYQDLEVRPGGSRYGGDYALNQETDNMQLSIVTDAPGHSPDSFLAAQEVAQTFAETFWSELNKKKKLNNQKDFAPIIEEAYRKAYKVTRESDLQSSEPTLAFNFAFKHKGKKYIIGENHGDTIIHLKKSDGNIETLSGEKSGSSTAHAGGAVGELWSSMKQYKVDPSSGLAFKLYAREEPQGETLAFGSDGIGDADPKSEIISEATNDSNFSPEQIAEHIEKKIYDKLVFHNLVQSVLAIAQPHEFSMIDYDNLYKQTVDMSDPAHPQKGHKDILAAGCTIEDYLIYGDPDDAALLKPDDTTAMVLKF